MLLLGHLFGVAAVYLDLTYEMPGHLALRAYWRIAGGHGNMHPLLHNCAGLDAALLLGTMPPLLHNCAGLDAAAWKL